MKKKTWILFLGDLAIAYNRELLRGVSFALQSKPTLQGYAVRHVAPAELAELSADDVAGMLVSGIADAEDALRGLANAGVAMVEVAGKWQRPWLEYHVRADDVAVGRLAAEHLMARGFTRFAYLGYPGHMAMVLRRQGFGEALAAHKLNAVFFETTAVPAEAGRHWWPPGMLEWARRIAKPAAIFACNDMRANALLIACEHAGIRVPEDISVVGVDDDDVYRALRHPHLSSIQLQTPLIAQTALAMLLQLMQHRKPVENVVLIPPGPLIVRASSNILAAEDELVRAALAMINNKLSDGISVKMLANALAVSRTTLEVRFAASLHRSPAAEIRRLQLEKAKALLAATRLAMPSVAQQSGYSSGKHLSIAFRRSMGITPSDYRREHGSHASRG